MQEYHFRCPVKVLRQFVAKVKNASYSDVLFDNMLEISESEQYELEDLIKRYELQEPISKILNRKYFWNHEFFVNEFVLDPRPETEIIVEQSLLLFEKQQHFSFLDIGTGSGCISLSIASEFPNAKGIGIDYSEAAIEVAKINQQRLNISNVTLENCSWNEFNKNIPPKKFDLIVSNPPYIRRDDIPNLDANVRNFDPHLALDGGSSGLEAYMQLAPLIAEWLKPSGYVLLEIGYGQQNDVRNIFENAGLHCEKTILDGAGISRIICFMNTNKNNVI